MKKLYLIFALFIAAGTTKAQTLFTYGNNAVDRAEFLRAYNKNKTTVTDRAQSLREYLDLYTKFKLKVKAARDLRLDTLPQLKNDVEAFKTQIQEGYMNNEPALKQLVEEAYNRSQHDLHVIHFYAPFDSLKGADTAKAYKALNEVSQLMGANGDDYDKVAATLTEKYTKVKGGDLGFVTVFTLPYEYENLVYGLHAGETSKIYRSSKGIHVFKLLEQRKSVGRWKVAQILLSIPPGDAGNTVAVKKKADSVYQLATHGGDFNALAKAYSEDKMTYMIGGEMPEFGTGRFDISFEKEVFKLTQDDQITPPFLTPYGYHIVKRLKQTPVPATKDDVYMMDLRQKVMQDNRVQLAKDAFLKDVARLVPVKQLNTVKQAELFRFADSVATNPMFSIDKKVPVYDKPLFSVGKTTVKGAEWLNYIRDYKVSSELYKGETNAQLYEKFVNKSVLDYYRNNLEEFNPEFRYQMDEFRDGNMLFEIMERNVWSSAGNDTAALQSYYNQNKGKYMWGPSASILVFNCSNKKVAEEALAELKAGRDWHKIVEERNGAVQADSGRYELSQIPLENGQQPSPGLITNISVNSMDGSASFIKFLLLFDGNLQRSFEEARGLVINDYQVIIENKWIEQLKKKYPVKVNDAVFDALIKE